MGFPNLSSVATDDIDGAASAMGFLLDAGHRAVGVIGGESCVVSPELLCNTSQLRLTGCIRACAQRGVPFDPASQTAQAVSPWRAATRAPGSCWTVCRS